MTVFRNKNIRSAFWALCLILLTVFSCAKEEAIPIDIDFSIEVVDNDFSVPVRVRITNNTEGAETFSWTFNGATPSSSTSQNPGIITYNEAGNFTISLEASNQDEVVETKDIEVEIDAEIVIGFSTQIITDNFPPMEVALTNTTVGADIFNWSFENGEPASSTDQHPENVIFNNPGEYIIALEVSNGLETFQTEQTVTVAPHLVADFDYEVDFLDDDFQAPVTLTMINNSISATDYTWTFQGGTPSSTNEVNPSVTFNNPGEYTLQLEATNGKESQTISKTITVVPNTNLRVFEDIQLGTSVAHNTNSIGAFFSATIREVFTAEAVTEENGEDIDIVFFGLNQNFNFNKFVSPDQAQANTFSTIPNATSTVFINSLESCACSASLSVAQFNSMTDDTLLDALTIEETVGGIQDFNSDMVPRIVLFQTEDGRKGAIKIKQYVANGDNSHILVDIKVQKNGQ